MVSLKTILRGHRTDAVLCLLLAAASIAYLMLRRWPLGASDEAYYFYHAVRMLEGEVLYRDISELTTPFLMDLLALAFQLFGETITTGRAVGACIQALLVIVIYASARTLGAGRVLACAAAVTQIAVGQPAWPYTTPHWLAVLFVCLLLLISLDRNRARVPGWIVTQGVLLGLLLATRQHAGVAIGLGMTLLVFADSLSDRRWGQVSGPPLLRHILLLAAGTLAGSVLVMGPHLVMSGFGPMFYQLVIYPLTVYREFNQTTWGSINWLFNVEPYTWPMFLKLLPVAVAITALRAAAAWLLRRDRQTAETLLVLAMFGGSAIAYTMSFPDLIHLAMILPAILIVATELLTAVLGIMGRWKAGAQGAVGVVLIVACATQLQGNYERSLAKYPVLHDTPFGRMAFAGREQVAEVEWVRSALDQDSSNELLCYPGWPAIYLMTGARNPTRHDLIMPGYQSDEEIRRLIDTIEEDRVGHILLFRQLIRPGDPVDAHVTANYQCTSKGRLQHCTRSDGE